MFIIKLFMFFKKKRILKTDITSYFDSISSPMIAEMDKCTSVSC